MFTNAAEGSLGNHYDILSCFHMPLPLPDESAAYPYSLLSIFKADRILLSVFMYKGYLIHHKPQIRGLPHCTH